MNNLDAFELSVANSKIYFDFSNPKGKVVIPKTKDLENELTMANKKIMEYITTYKTIKDSDLVSLEYKESIIYEIMKIIDTTEYINYSSFCVYFQVLNFSWSTFNSTKKKKLLSDSERAELLKKVVELFIENRHDMYLSHGYSNMSLQVQCDSSSSRRRGNEGAKSLKAIMKKYNIKFVSNYSEFMDENSYFFPENNVSLFLNVLKNNNIDFNFRKSRDNKNPDLIFKIKDQFYILEHKLATGGGGSQNMELNEIIEFIGQKESNANVHYISCLQGDKIADLTSSIADPKTKIQYINVIENLKNHLNNYFVNEFGLDELLKTIIK